MLISALTPNKIPHDKPVSNVCYKRVVKMCDRLTPKVGTDFLFAFIGCPFVSTRFCGVLACKESYYVMQVFEGSDSNRVKNFKTVATESDLDGSCENLAIFPSGTLLYWMYFVFLRSLMRNATFVLS